MNINNNNKINKNQKSFSYLKNFFERSKILFKTKQNMKFLCLKRTQFAFNLDRLRKLKKKTTTTYSLCFLNFLNFLMNKLNEHLFCCFFLF